MQNPMAQNWEPVDFHAARELLLTSTAPYSVLSQGQILQGQREREKSCGVPACPRFGVDISDQS